MNGLNSKKFICILLSAIIVAGAFAACTAKRTVETAETVAGETQTEAETIEAPDEEVISFTATDEAGNVLTLVPIYDADANTIIAGYVQSAVDKNGTALDANTLTVIGSVVGVTKTENALTLDLDENKNILVIETYSDESGALTALKDVKDLNKNNDKEEFLKLNSATDANGIIRYMVEYTAVVIEKKKDGTAVLKEGTVKTTVKLVDKDNTEAAKKIEEDKEHNEEQPEPTTVKPTEKPSKEEEETTGESTSKEEPSSQNEPTSGEDPTLPEDTAIGIVLKPNRTAQCSEEGVAISTGEVVITAPGDYKITSDTGSEPWHGQIIVKLPNTEKAEIAFHNVHIQNDSSNIIQIIDTSIDEDRSFLETESELGSYADDFIEVISEYDMAPNVQLSFPEGTKNSFVTTANSHTGVLYNESKLTIKGHGSADFSSVRNTNSCICSTKSIKIRNVTLNLKTPQNESTSAVDKTTGSAKGIFSYSRVTVESGSVNIKTNGDGVRCDVFEMQSGSGTIASSACDGIDADDAILINGGNVTVTALQKSSFKVRRVNNTEKGYIKGRMRPDKGDTFAINGGTVIGESKKISTVQPDSAQASLSCRIVKKNRGTELAAEEVKTPAYISIDGVKSSSNKCIKFLYSSSSLSKGTLYAASANGKSTTMTAADWNVGVGTINVITV